MDNFTETLLMVYYSLWVLIMNEAVNRLPKKKTISKFEDWLSWRYLE